MTKSINLMCEPSPYMWGAKSTSPPPQGFTTTDEDGTANFNIVDEDGTARLNVGD